MFAPAVACRQTDECIAAAISKVTHWNHVHQPLIQAHRRHGVSLEALLVSMDAGTDARGLFARSLARLLGAGGTWSGLGCREGDATLFFRHSARCFFHTTRHLPERRASTTPTGQSGSCDTASQCQDAEPTTFKPRCSAIPAAASKANDNKQ